MPHCRELRSGPSTSAAAWPSRLISRTLLMFLEPRSSCSYYFHDDTILSVTLHYEREQGFLRFINFRLCPAAQLQRQAYYLASGR